MSTDPTKREATLSGRAQLDELHECRNNAPAEQDMLAWAFEAGYTKRAAEPADRDTSDGRHTFDELYEYRMLYNAHAAQGWLAQGIPVVKSRTHSDGEPCFGGGWFIVTATLSTGQVSNHYRLQHWDLFDVPEVDLPPEHDGHTPEIAAKRLRSALHRHARDDEDAMPTGRQEGVPR